MTSSKAIIAEGWQAYKKIKGWCQIKILWKWWLHTMPPCHPSVPLIGKIPPIWSTLVLGGHLWQWLTVTRAKTIETINRNPDILGSKMNNVLWQRKSRLQSLSLHCLLSVQNNVVDFIERVDSTVNKLASLRWNQIFEINWGQQIHFWIPFATWQTYQWWVVNY